MASIIQKQVRYFILKLSDIFKTAKYGHLIIFIKK